MKLKANYFCKIFYNLMIIKEKMIRRKYYLIKTINLNEHYLFF